MPAEPNSRFTEQWDALDPWDEDYPHLWIKVEHLGRYLFAARYLRAVGATRVADIACGWGYGSRELADSCDHVAGIDRDLNLIDAARSRYRHGRLRFDVANIAKSEIARVIVPGSIDGIVSFETIEHLVDPAAALAQFAYSLRDGGYLLLSVPIGAHEHLDNLGMPTNREHKRTYTASSIIELTNSAGFETIEVLGQPLIGEINRTETRLIRRKETDGRIGDEKALHQPTMIRRISMLMGMPQPRDIERSYSLTLICRRTMSSKRVEHLRP